MSRLVMEYHNKILLAKKMGEIMDEFEKQNSDEGRGKMALGIMHNYKPPEVTCGSKEKSKSIEFRNNGNRIFVSHKDEPNKLILAWEMYSKSIAFAENLSEELALAYANRSYVLFSVGKYTECIEDIDRALQLNYPEHLKAKLLSRKAESLLELGNPDVQDSCKEAIHWLEKISLDDKTRKVLETKIHAINSVWKNSIPQKIVRNKQKSLPSYKMNPKIPCASNSLAIKYNEKFGKHVVTTRKVHAGEVLVIEKPYLVVLKPEDIYTHCSHCLQIAWASIPCERCIYAMYCSQKCKDEAWKQYHDIECPVKGCILNMQMNDLAPLSMRLAVLAIREAGSIENLKEELKEIESCKDPIAKCLSVGDVYRSDRYRALYSLVTHTEKRFTSVLFNMALNAAFILYCIITKTTFFGKKTSRFSDMYQNGDVVFVAGLVLRHYQIIQMNDHGYSELRNEINYTLGAAVLPFLSLVNHSCNPSVTRCPSMGSFILYALHPIEKDTQIFDDYGFYFATSSKFDRDALIKPYHFKCECPACRKNWPLFQGLSMFDKSKCSKAVQLKLHQAASKCATADNNLKMKKLDKLPSIITDLTQAIGVFHDNMTMPCYELVLAFETFRQAFTLLYGERFEVPSLR